LQEEVRSWEEKGESRTRGGQGERVKAGEQWRGEKGVGRAGDRSRKEGKAEAKKGMKVINLPEEVLSSRASSTPL